MTHYPMHTIDHCMSRVNDLHYSARFFLRMAARDPCPAHWGLEHKYAAEARRLLRDAILWIAVAKGVHHGES